MKNRELFLVIVCSVLYGLLIVGCKPEDEVLIVTVTEEGCQQTEVLSGWVLTLPIDGSGEDKVIIRHTEALRKMARTGNVNDLREELCNYFTDRVAILQTGHQSDINQIGFAPQLQVEHYIIAMYHPNNYPDHFIVYNINNKEWTRWDENDFPTEYLTGTGD